VIGFDAIKVSKQFFFCKKRTKKTFMNLVRAGFASAS